MKKILLATVLLSISLSTAHAETYSNVELTSCATEQGLEEFMGAAYFGNVPYQEVLKTLSDAGVDCTLATHSFEMVRLVKSFDDKGVTYDLVEIKMDDGTTRYAFHYYKTPQGDKT